MATIQGNSKVGDGTWLGNRVIVGYPTAAEMRAQQDDPTYTIAGALVGSNCTIRDFSIIYSTAVLGNNVRTGHYILVREETTVGNDVLIGTHSVIDNDCRIGRGTSIQTGVYIPTGSTIGEGCFLGPNATLTNDKEMLYNDEPLQPVTLEDNVRIGANSTILPGVVIGAGAVVGGGAVVTRDVPAGAVVAGVPARSLR